VSLEAGAKRLAKAQRTTLNQFIDVAVKRLQRYVPSTFFGSAQDAAMSMALWRASIAS
jgi:hypothetical protein